MARGIKDGASNLGKTGKGGGRGKSVLNAQRNSRDLPGRSRPNDTRVKDYGDGKGQIRDCGPDGKAKVDDDFGHDHGGTGDPHAHDFDFSGPRGVRGPARSLMPGE